MDFFSSIVNETIHEKDNEKDDNNDDNESVKSTAPLKIENDIKEMVHGREKAIVLGDSDDGDFESGDDWRNSEIFLFGKQRLSQWPKNIKKIKDRKADKLLKAINVKFGL